MQRPKVASRFFFWMVVPGAVDVVVAVGGGGGILDFHLEAWLLKMYERNLEDSHDFW